jgi:hypothetical protein
MVLGKKQCYRHLANDFGQINGKIWLLVKNSAAPTADIFRGYFSVLRPKYLPERQHWKEEKIQ